MISPSIEKELHQRLAGLSADQQRKVLDFASSLDKPPKQGVPGDSLLPFAGSIPLDDLERMKAVIEADCERIEVDD
jgi:hypothetical protein